LIFKKSAKGAFASEFQKSAKGAFHLIFKKSAKGAFASEFQKVPIFEIQNNKTLAHTKVIE